MINLYNVNNHNHNHNEGQNNGQPILSNTSSAKKSGGFEKYNDPTGEFGSKELKWGIWYVANKVLLYRILLWSLIVISVLTWVFSAWRLTKYFVLEYNSFQKLERELGVFYNFESINPQYTAMPLNLGPADIFPGGVNKYDVVAEVSNTNASFIVSFDYYFDFGTFKTPTSRGFLLPGETLPFATLGLTEEEIVGTPNLVLEKISWRRLSGHEIPDVAYWKATHLNFVIENFKFIPSNSNGADANSIIFTIKNDSAFGYKDPLFYVGLYRGGDFVGLLPLKLDKISSQEIAEVDLRSFINNLSVDSVVVYPIIDITDPAVFLEPGK